MSFEGTKKRLVEEFDQAQAQIRAEFGMAERSKKLGDDPSDGPARRSTRPAGPPSIAS